MNGLKPAAPKKIPAEIQSTKSAELSTVFIAETFRKNFGKTVQTVDQASWY